MKSYSAAATILLLVIGCQTASRPTAARLETLRGEATAALENGEVDNLGDLSAKGLEESTRFGDPAWIWRFKHLRFEFLIAGANDEEALHILDGPPPDSLLPRILVDRARAYIQMRRFPEADQALRTAADLPLDSESGLPVELEVIRADWLRRSSRLVDAEKQYEKAYNAARAAGLRRLESKAAGNLAFLQMTRGDLDQAITSYEAVLQGAEAVNEIGSVLRALTGLGRCYFGLGSLDRARESYQKALARATEAHDAYHISESQGGLGNVYFGLRDFDRASDSYQKALEVATSDKVKARWLNNLASVQIERGRWNEAQEFNDQAIALREKSGDGQMDYSLVNRAEIFVGQGNTVEARAVLSELLERRESLQDEVLWETYASLGELAVLAEDDAEAARNYQLALDQIEKGRERLDLQESQITFRSKWNHFSQSYVDFLVRRGRTVDALERAEASRAVVLSEGLGIHRGRKRPKGVPFQEVSKRLNAVLLSFWVAPKRSFLWVVTPDRMRMFELPGSEEIDSLVEGYANYLVHYLDPLAPTGSPNAFGVALYDTLIKPAEGMIPPGSNVLLAPDGRLNDLNFETLLIDGENPRYWIEDVTLAVAPSLAIVQPESPKTRADKSLLLIGDPTTADKAFPALPAVKTEIENIRNQFAADDQLVIVGAQAVPTAYSQAHPERYRLVHFAAHAVSNPIHPLEHSVILSPPEEGGYRLYAYDVEEIPLDAAVVTLSACRSAGAKAYSGEGLVGFAWAFLKAGARNVTAGLWDVDDKSGAKLMERYYAGMVAGKSPATALRQAKLELLKEPGNWTKPVYWAPFQVYTRSSPFNPIR